MIKEGYLMKTEEAAAYAQNVLDAGWDVSHVLALEERKTLAQMVIDLVNQLANVSQPASPFSGKPMTLCGALDTNGSTRLRCDRETGHLGEHTWEWKPRIEYLVGQLKQAQPITGDKDGENLWKLPDINTVTCNQSLGTHVNWTCSRGTIGCTNPHGRMEDETKEKAHE